MVRSFRVLVIALALSLACTSYVRKGDRAAAVGNWKSAVHFYYLALQDEPNSEKLRRKYKQAKANAIHHALAAARRCKNGGNFRCAENEADYVLQLDASSEEAEELRRGARKGRAMNALDEAREAANRARFDDAFEALDSARGGSQDAEVKVEADELEARVVQDAVRHAEGLLQRAESEPHGSRLPLYSESHEVLSAVVERAPEHRPLLERARAKYQQVALARARELEEEADRKLEERRWREAEQLLAEAAELDPRGSAGARLEYARALSAADSAIQRRDFPAAANALRRAIRSGRDTEGWAQDLLEKIQVKRYKISFDAVAISPVRPGTNKPWIGKPDTALASVVGGAVGLYFGGLAGAKVGSQLAASLESVDHRYHPTVFAELVLPDGRRFQGGGKSGLYVSLASEVVLESNAYDSRELVLRLFHHTNGETADFGVVRLRLGDLIAKSDAANRDGADSWPHAILGLQVSVSEAPRDVPGRTYGLRLKKEAGDKASDWSKPAPGAAGYRIDRIEVFASESDVGDDAFGPPDLFVKISQDGRTIYRAKRIKDERRGAWSPRATYVFLPRAGQLEFELVDKDPADNDHVATWRVTGAELARGKVERRSPGGSTLSVRVSQRQEGPH